MTDTFNINSFEIFIAKQDDSIIIRCLDNKLFKVYSEVFDVVTIDDLCPVGIDNFYKICKNNFQMLQINSQQNIQDIDTIFLCKQNKIEIKINYDAILTFSFVLNLPLQKNTPISGVELYVKKLEKEIDELKEYINDSMYVNVYYKRCNCCNFYAPTCSYLADKSTKHTVDIQTIFLIPIKCKKIILIFKNFGGLNVIEYSPSDFDFENLVFTFRFHECPFTQLTPDCKKTKCKILEINGDFPYDFKYKYLPSSIECIIIDNIETNIINVFNNLIKCNLPNLKEISIARCDCSAITQTLIENLKINKISACGACKNFTVVNSDKVKVHRF
jgi:hypothetical protein